MYIDLILALIMILSIGMGIKKGFMFEFFTIFGIFISMLFTRALINPVSNNLIKVEENSIQYVFVYIIIFLSVYGLLFLVIFLSKKFFETIFLGWVDKVAGGVLGFLKGVLVSTVILVLVVVAAKFNSEVELQLKASFSGKTIEYTAPLFKAFLPKDFGKKFEDYMRNDKMNEIIDKILEEELKKLNLGEVDNQKLKEEIKKSVNSDSINKIKESELENLIDSLDLENIKN